MLLADMSTDAHEVYPGLWIGSEDEAFADEILDKFNPTVTHVLNVAEEVYTHLACGSPRKYKKVCLTDIDDIIPVLPSCMDFIEDGLANGEVMVHCKHGLNRSAAVVVAYICKVTGKTPFRVRDEIRLIRPQIFPAIWFLNEIQTWLETLKISE